MAFVAGKLLKVRGFPLPFSGIFLNSGLKKKQGIFPFCFSQAKPVIRGIAKK